MHRDQYPFDHAGSVACAAEDGLRHWFAVYTASHNEKAVERTLRQKGLETFLPLYRVKRRRTNRTTVELDLPLFEGYVFTRIALSESVLVRSIPRVFSIVGNSKGPLSLPEVEVESLRTALTLNNATPWAQIKVGARARIANGPLSGWEGVIVRVDGGLRIVLSVEMISKSFAVRVNAEDLEFCDETAPGRRAEDDNAPLKAQTCRNS
jgi:transcription antitermination factor NusG